MKAYILDTSVLSPLLDSEHGRHVYVRQRVQQLEQDATILLSAVSLAELRYGVNLARSFGHARLPVLQQALFRATQYGALDITHHTAEVYAELKAKLARTYLKGRCKGPAPMDRGLGRQEHWPKATNRRKRLVDVCASEGARLAAMHGRHSDVAHLRRRPRRWPSHPLNLAPSEKQRRLTAMRVARLRCSH